MATEFTMRDFSRVNYCPSTNTFWVDPMVAEPGWQPTTPRQLLRYPTLRTVDYAEAPRALETHDVWSLSIADTNRAAIAFCYQPTSSVFSPKRARALYDALADLLRRAVPTACVVSDIAGSAVRLALPPQVSAADVPLLAFVATAAIRSIDWSDATDYDPFIVDVYDEASSRLFVRFRASDDGSTIGTVE